MPLVLASASPRRQELLRSRGLEFVVIPSHVDEEAIVAPSPAALVEDLALRKAQAVAAGLGEGIVIGADTLVVLDGEVLGKPRTADEAAAMLRRLAGRTHRVVTGVAVVAAPGGESLVEHEVTEVTFRRLSDDEIRRYVATGEPMDKAGAYGIQGKGGALVAGISGCYFNVVGLPLARLATMLRRFGICVL